jgi:uridine kinase
VADHEAMKIYEASLRYLVAMAFHNCYPNLKIRFAYNVSRCVSIHLIEPKTVATTAMLIKIDHEIQSSSKPPAQADGRFSNADAAKIYAERGFTDKLEILQYRPEKTVHLYECNGYLGLYVFPHGSLDRLPHKYKLRLYTPGFLLQYPRSECGGEDPGIRGCPDLRPHPSRSP